MKIPVAATDRIGTLETISPTTWTMNAQSAAVMMRVQSELYHQPSAAVLREYVTNGIDAHAAIGSTEPVGVTLPTDFAPSLVITDHGVGMSHAYLVWVYEGFSISDKRDTDEQVGMFGIGMKSFLSITREIVVRTVHDGMLNVVILSLNKDGLPAHSTSVRDLPTGEVSGTTVTIPVSDIPAMNRAVRRTLGFFPTGTLLVDGVLNTCLLDDCERVGQNVVMVKDTQFANGSGDSGAKAFSPHRVVTGGISYALTDAQVSDMNKALPAGMAKRLVFTADIEQVCPNPSREVLAEDPMTTAWLRELFASLPKMLGDYADEVVCNHHSPLERSARWLESQMPAMKVTPTKYPSINRDVGTQVVVHSLSFKNFRVRRVATETSLYGPDDARSSGSIIAVQCADKPSHISSLSAVMNDQGWEQVVVVAEDSGQKGWFHWGTPSSDHHFVGAEEFMKMARKVRGARTTTPSAAVSGTRTWEVRLPLAGHGYTVAHLLLSDLVRLREAYGELFVHAVLAWYQTSYNKQVLALPAVVLSSTRSSVKMPAYFRQAIAKDELDSREYIMSVNIDSYFREADDQKVLSHLIASRTRHNNKDFGVATHPFAAAVAEIDGDQAMVPRKENIEQKFAMLLHLDGLTPVNVWDAALQSVAPVEV